MFAASQVSDVQKKPDHRLPFINHYLFSSQLPRRLQQQRFLSSFFCFFFPLIALFLFFFPESLNLSSQLFPSVNPSCCVKIREQRDEHPTVQLLTASLLAAQLYGCLHMVFAFCWRERYVWALKPNAEPSLSLWNIETHPERERERELY